MIRKILFWVLGIALAGAFVWTIWFLYQKSQKPPEEAKVKTPFTTNIVKKSVATGSIKPRLEVNIKPAVTGIIDQLYVEAGQVVTVGQPLARIRILPNVVQLNNAEAQLDRARINLENHRRELDRNKPLMEQKVISDVQYNQFLLNFKLAEQEVSAAETNLQLVREGASKRGGNQITLVTSTINGLVLDVPLKAGGSVIERSNFNEGTTIATIANMSSMIFEGEVDESEVGRLYETMPLKLTVGALDTTKFDAKLEYVSPKGTLKDGAIKFQIRAAVTPRKGFFLRAGYSANADIVIGERKQVLAIEEANVIFKGDSTFVEVMTSDKPQKFQKRAVRLGLSDGVNAEVVEGLNAKDQVKILNPTEEKPKNG